ncbi:MAG: helix-turn-helix domain-containing protein [Myxococcaceae bacterium]|nr:helix-turn-helix domain-containing protein [Myxococcaceae bacterium]
MTTHTEKHRVTTLHVSTRLARLLADLDRATSEQWFSVADAARQLGVHPNTVRNAVARRELPHCRVGRRVLVRLPTATR